MRVPLPAARCCVALTTFFWLLCGIVGPARGAGDDLHRALASEAPELSSAVLDKALTAMDCALADGANPARSLAVIDFSLPSSEPRLWIFDLQEQRLLLHELVAHGQGSGDNRATRFSNVEGSHQSSLGLFRTAESYVGRHGYSLRMDGLEPGVNDAARQRAIVIHGADYVASDWIDRQGRIGRSLGCPAVPREVAEQVVDSLKDGQFLFSYFPDPDWLAESGYLNCQAARLASRGTNTGS